MRISVLGLGYVGTVSAACFASRGHTVIGVDANTAKVDLVNSGQCPFVEPGLQTLIAKAVQTGRLAATTECTAAVASSDITFVCVGTPSAQSGAIDLSAIRSVCCEIGAALKQKASKHVVVIRSTVLPGTYRTLVVPELERNSGKRAGRHFDVVCNPEFLRESTAVADFYNPPKTVIGVESDEAAAIVSELYSDLPGPLVRTSPDVAEFIKYVDNPWHALKVAFANEIGNLCQRAGVDSRSVMDIFLLDRKLNLSEAYLRPGFAFGGSCLPKDLRAITYFAKNLDVQLPLLNSVLPSNRVQIERALDAIIALGVRRIGVLGCSFKMNSDDLRESPFVDLIERLIGKGFHVNIFDPNVRLSGLLGANREHVLSKLPHISAILSDSVEAALQGADVVLLTSLQPEYIEAVSGLDENTILFDFAGLGDRRTLRASYIGVNW